MLLAWCILDKQRRTWNNEGTVKNQKNVLLLGSVGLIVLAIGFVAVLDRISSPAPNTSDIRARAGITNMLKLNGTVDDVDEINGTLTVRDVYFADVSRSGEAKNLGTWTVAAPSGFNFASVAAGTPVVIGVDPKTFVVTSHTMIALTITPATR